MDELAGCVVIDGAVQTVPFTMTTVLPSCEPQAAETRTQYPVVTTGETTVLVLVASGIGLEVSPWPPVYH